jgi:glycosyltransferase involved in cell wall biosynthesis
MVSKTFVHLGLGWIADHGGGLERYQNTICTDHARLGCSVEAWVQSRTPIQEHPKYRVIAYASPTESRRAKLRKLRAIARERFAQRDFTFVSHHASVSASLTDLLLNVPHIVHFQGPWADEAAMEAVPFWKTFLQRRQERKAYHSADRIITLSEAFKKIVVDRYDVSPEIVRVVPGGIDSIAADPKISRIEARHRMGWPTDRPIVLAMRRLVRRVGVDVLVEAIGLLHKKTKHQDAPKRDMDALFLIGGAGPLKEEVAKRIEALGLKDHVRLLGFVPDKLLSTAYRAADFSIVPTQSLEGFGLVTIESMATGTPVVVTPVGSLPEIMNPLNPNLVMSGTTADAIAASLQGFLSGAVAMPDEHACREYVRANYDGSVIAPRVLEVYRSASL